MRSVIGILRAKAGAPPRISKSDGSLIGRRNKVPFFAAATPADRRRPSRANDVKEFVRLKDARPSNRIDGAIIARRGRPSIGRLDCGRPPVVMAPQPQTTNLAVRSSNRHFGTKLGTQEPAVFALEAPSVRSSTLLDPMMRTSFLEALSERAQVIAAVAAALGSHTPAGSAWRIFSEPAG